MTDAVSPRQLAIAEGRITYLSGKPCKYGHIAERKVRGGCMECVRLSSKARMKSLRADPATNDVIKQRRNKSANKRWKAYRDRLYERAAGSPRPTRCQVCESDRTICFDHNHATGKFRGWLCNRCNMILGWVCDDPDLLRQLASYLEK